jgi:glycosyltransferase involved in cell wall biosynthesis
MVVLSIVTPVYNSARYLTDALDSVARITVPREHIVIDGGSTDGTVDLLRERNDSALVWVSEADRGQTHAVNKGFERANGEILGWLNGDDEYIPEAIDRAVGHMLANPEVEAVFGGMHFVDSEGCVRRRYQPGRYSWRRYLYQGDYIQTPVILFRRRALERVGMLDEAYKDAADYDFYLRVFHGARVDRMPRAHVRFRIHPESKTIRDVWLQQDEALAIRLKWARTPIARAVMRALDRAKRAILPRISPWPRPYAE